jgi:hypothetical protein
LSANGRAFFENMAKEYKQQAAPSVSSVTSSSYERYTSQNVPLSKLAQEAKQIENKENSMKKYINDIIYSANLQQSKFLVFIENLLYLL